MNDVKIKQQVAEKIKNSTNILVTVSSDPSVDALSAALGLTLMLNKLDKHATAVFSGAIPPAITFLDPEKTFEATTDSLRDFIIALDKEKADHLRYKVEGDVVKIFITPYRTTITSDDLQFSQGDYNVDLVMALGVDNQDHLDQALESHGKILHDAAVVTLSAGEQVSQLGSIDWRDEQASSLCEMLVSVVESLKSDKDKPLLDKQTATALLTGIVASTDRFSNTKTSSKVMTVAAQLMAAGADQQLIAAKLQESHEIGQLATADNGIAMTESPTKVSPDEPAKPADGGLSIAHSSGETLEEIANSVKVQDQQAAADEAEQALAEQVSQTTATIAQQPVGAYAPEQPMSGGIDWQPTPATEPSLGGTLNATTEQAADDSRREEEDDKNKTILTHSYLSSTPTYDAPINSVEQSEAGSASVDIFAGTPESLAPPVADQAIPAGETVIQPLGGGPTLAELDAKNREEAASTEPSVMPGPAPEPIAPSVAATLPQPPPLPDFSQLPPPSISPAYALDPEPTVPAPERLGDIFAPESAAPAAPPVLPTDTPTTNDPSQFKIPGQ